MRILTQANARTLWYVRAEDINPNGLDLMPLYAGLQAHYKFRVYPVKLEELNPPIGGIVFGRGSFHLDDGQVVEIVRLEMFSDGLMLDTRHSTAVSDKILGDIITFASKTYRLTFEPSMVQKKAYVSEVVATTNVNLGSLSPKLQQFATLLADVCGEQLVFQPDQIRFGTDSARPPVSRFRFERQDGIHFSENRYCSIAPTTTEKHQQLLDALECMLSD